MLILVVNYFLAIKKRVIQVSSFKTTALATAVLLTLSSGAVQAAQPNSEIKALKSVVSELQKQLQELKQSNSRASTPSLEQARVEELAKQVSALREQLAQQKTAAQAEKSAAAAPIAGAEESEETIAARTAATKADVQGLRADIENYKYDQSRLQERNIPSVTRNTKIGGSITARYDYQDEAVTPGNAGGVTTPSKHGFAPLGFALNFSGNLYRDYAEGRNLTYRLALSGSNSAGSTTTSLTDAYLRYSFQPSTGNVEDPLGTITLGQQTVAFGLDAQATDPEVKAVINNAGFVSGLGLGTRQTGLVLAGDFDPYVDFSNNYRAPLLSYSLGLFNGNGANRGDNNNAKDVAGRLVYTLPVDYSSWLRQLQIGASYYRGAISLAPAAPAVQTETKKGTDNRYGLDINWTHLPYTVTYEVAQGKKDLISATAKNPDAVQRGRGQYLNLGYTWGEQFLKSATGVAKYDDFWPKSYQAFVRFDEFDANRSSLSLNDKVLATTLGLNIFFAETTKLQINYTRTRNQTPSATAPAKVNAVAALLNAAF